MIITIVIMMYIWYHNTETYMCESWLPWRMYHSTNTILVGSCLDTDIRLAKTTSKAYFIDPMQGRGRRIDP